MPTAWIWLSLLGDGPLFCRRVCALLVGLSKDVEDRSLQEGIRRECVDYSDSWRRFLLDANCSEIFGME